MAESSAIKTAINPIISKCKTSSILTRDDFDAGPVSANKIDGNLWLGNLSAACDMAFLIEHNILHILTVDSVPLPRVMTECRDLTTKYIQVADIPKEDIISHFTEANEFIEKGLEFGPVLVHCYFGMSRSAAFVIAYVMYKHKLTFEEAFYIVKARRKITHPNSGFIAQLKLYSQMKCVLDQNYPKYKQFRLRMAAEYVRKVKILPQNCSNLVKPDPGLNRERPDPMVYRCKKCRRIVACQSNIIPHIPHDVKVKMNEAVIKKRESRSNSKQEGREKWDLSCIQNGQNLIEKLKSIACSNGEVSKKDDTLENKDSSSSEDTDLSNEIVISKEAEVVDNSAEIQEDPQVCLQTYFVEPLAWMQDIHKNVQGKLLCPKCSNKLGSFSWIMGCQCPCGSKVAPAFYLVPSKVDKSNVVQNVQVTV